MMYRINRLHNDQALKKKIFIVGIIGILPFLFLAIMGFVAPETVTTIDYSLGSIIISLRELTRTELAIWVTRLADASTQAIVTIAVVIILLLARKWRVSLWYGLSVLIGSLFLNTAVKELYKRVRPEEIEHLIKQSGYAFPSGHSMGAVIVYGGLLFLFIRYVKAGHWKWVASVLVAILCLMIGLSRIYLGVHFLSDVLGGFSLGFSFLSFSIAILGLKVTRREFKSLSNNRFYSRK